MLLAGFLLLTAALSTGSCLSYDSQDTDPLHVLPTDQLTEAEAQAAVHKLQLAERGETQPTEPPSAVTPPPKQPPSRQAAPSTMVTETMEAKGVFPSDFDAQTDRDLVEKGFLMSQRRRKTFASPAAHTKGQPAKE
ncbi:unnamed protein product [Vitrella brassicaformis CCMP3155]|uniref:RxLR effector protein n=1 Tax=Vitrella brassicaformis (strain CCMP3155) TaxID=1169540 RepID=A0A0G4EJD9_VITBC|nr:unnamed protein product [Vitrella brassicaformis CCMP3155]|eukprot:CEL96600.1 unnamed protein product [Vitrella brassicaformis CCMP3155]